MAPNLKYKIGCGLSSFINFIIEFMSNMRGWEGRRYIQKIILHKNTTFIHFFVNFMADKLIQRLHVIMNFRNDQSLKSPICFN